MQEGRTRKLWCVACPNVKSKETDEKGIAFHMFPPRHEILLQWMQAMRQAGLIIDITNNLGSLSRVCSEHFEASSFSLRKLRASNATIRCLKHHAVPSIFKSNSNQEATPKRNSEQKGENIANVDDFDDDEPRLVMDLTAGDDSQSSLNPANLCVTSLDQSDIHNQWAIDRNYDFLCNTDERSQAIKRKKVSPSMQQIVATNSHQNKQLPHTLDDFSLTADDNNLVACDQPTDFEVVYLDPDNMHGAKALPPETPSSQEVTSLDPFAQQQSTEYTAIVSTPSYPNITTNTPRSSPNITTSTSQRTTSDVTSASAQAWSQPPVTSTTTEHNWTEKTSKLWPSSVWSQNESSCNNPTETWQQSSNYQYNASQATSTEFAHTPEMGQLLPKLEEKEPSKLEDFSILHMQSAKYAQQYFHLSQSKMVALSVEMCAYRECEKNRTKKLKQVEEYIKQIELEKKLLTEQLSTNPYKACTIPNCYCQTPQYAPPNPTPTTNPLYNPMMSRQYLINQTPLLSAMLQQPSLGPLSMTAPNAMRQLNQFSTDPRWNFPYTSPNFNSQHSPINTRSSSEGNSPTVPSQSPHTPKSDSSQTTRVRQDSVISQTIATFSPASHVCNFYCSCPRNMEYRKYNEHQAGRPFSSDNYSYPNSLKYTQ